MSRKQRLFLFLEQVSTGVEKSKDIIVELNCDAPSGVDRKMYMSVNQINLFNHFITPCCLYFSVLRKIFITCIQMCLHVEIILYFPLSFLVPNLYIELASLLSNNRNIFSFHKGLQSTVSDMFMKKRAAKCHEKKSQ